MGISTNAQIVISALVRGSYHLYQGFGGFVGNFVMGLAFGWFYRRFGRLTPLVVAHFLLDAASFVGYALLSNIIRLP
jgi:membrane protease YdiL (CAAX protease family)